MLGIAKAEPRGSADDSDADRNPLKISTKNVGEGRGIRTRDLSASIGRMMRQRDTCGRLGLVVFGFW